jgi:hypothetical protein
MLVGFSVSKLGGERLGEEKGNITIGYSHKINNVESFEVSSIEKPFLKIWFDFEVKYEKDGKKIGYISMNGTALWDTKVKETIEYWKKNKKLPSDIDISFINSLYRKCLVQSVFISESLNLPSPVPMPRFVRKEK